MSNILLWLALVLLGYGVVPGIITLGFGFGVFKKSTTAREIAFTFDDGPHPKYTPELLHLLKQYGIKATFFVVGSKAEQFPDLILRIHGEGHLIGLHNYVHRTNWLMAPWTIRRELNRSASFIERIIGVRPVYYRPPWGLLNLFDFFLRKQFQFVLWSLMVGDWRIKGGSEKIKRRLLRRIKGGSVILLHDSGETFGADQDAPLQTIQALKEVLQEVQRRGYRCVRVDEMIRRHQQKRATFSLQKKASVHFLWMK